MSHVTCAEWQAGTWTEAQDGPWPRRSESLHLRVYLQKSANNQYDVTEAALARIQIKPIFKMVSGLVSHRQNHHGYISIPWIVVQHQM